MPDQAIIHCSISPAPLPDDQNHTSLDEGLDRLYDLGYSPEEVQMLRYHFHMMCRHEGSIKPICRREEAIDMEDRYLRGALPMINLQPEERVKSEWIRLENEGNGFDLLWGAASGLLCGVFALILVKSTQPRFVRLTRKQWLGIRLGAIVSTAVLLPVLIFSLSE